MKQVLFFFFLQSFTSSLVSSQSFTVDDLLTLSTLTAKNIDHFMNNNGFSTKNKMPFNDLTSTSFIEKRKKNKKDTLTIRSIDFYKKEDSKYFILHTTSVNEYIEGKKRIIKSGFTYDDKVDINRASSIFFQKKNITIEAISGLQDGIPLYTFLLKKKELPLPATIQHAEDLLNFDSHEYLVGFFGAANVKKDYYYFSEKEIIKCSVLFGNTSRQAVFIWNDEDNYSQLSYVLISNIIHTLSTKKFDGFIGINEWNLTNGVYPGMGLKELLKINADDFEIYGNSSELALMAKPGGNGKIDFKKTAITLSCNNCNNQKIFNTRVLKAMDLVDENLPVYIYNILIYPEHK